MYASHRRWKPSFLEKTSTSSSSCITIHRTDGEMKNKSENRTRCSVAMGRIRQSCLVIDMRLLNCFHRYYFPHHDARGAPRAATFIFYLTDVEEGGETIFVDLPAKSNSSTILEGVDPLNPSPEDILNGFVPLSPTPWRLQTPEVRAKFEAACRSDHYVKVASNMLNVYW